jgi:mRNA interferase YafQ
LEKFRTANELLTSNKELPRKYKDHPLTGNWAGHREFHLEPDWLVIYKKSKDRIDYISLGSHSELFR